MILPVELDKAYRLLNHGPTVLVTSAHKGHCNIMAAAWNMPLDFDPPKVAIVIDKKTYTRELIEASGSFAISVPCRTQAGMVVQVGSITGREMSGTITDKFAEFGVQTFAASVIEAPLVQGCSAWLECKVIPEPHIQQTYDLFVAEIVSAQADEKVFSEGRWHFECQEDLRSLHHVAGGYFFATGEPVNTSR